MLTLSRKWDCGKNPGYPIFFGSEDRWPGDQEREVLLAAAGGKRTDAAAVRGDGAPDCRPTGGDGAGRTVLSAKSAENEGGMGVRMEVIEKMQLAGFEVLEQAEGRLWRANGPAGEKKLQHVG